MKPSDSQLMMIEDGLPADLLKSKEERDAWWAANPPKAMPKFNVPKAHDQDTLKLLVELEVAKKAKTSNRLHKMLDKKQDHTGQHWDSRRARWINDDERQGKAMISITTNTRGATKMSTTKAYKDMSLAELAEAYNKISGKPPIKMFRSREAGLKRLESVEVTTAKKEVKAAAPAKANAPERKGIAAEFEFRVGTPREKLLLALNDHLNKMVPVDKLASLTLGSKSNDNVKMVSTLLAGVTWRIKVSKLPYEVKKEKKEGALSLGLFKKK